MDFNTGVLIIAFFLSIPIFGLVLVVFGKQRGLLTEIIGILNLVIGIPGALASIGYEVIGISASTEGRNFTIIAFLAMTCIGFILLSRKKKEKRISVTDKLE